MRSTRSWWPESLATRKLWPRRTPANRGQKSARTKAAGATDASPVQVFLRRWSLEGLTVERYDDVNMDGDFGSISMSINNRLLKQLLSIQQLPTQSRFKSHSSARPPQTPASSS